MQHKPVHCTDHNADINIRSDSDGATPLMRLCETEGYENAWIMYDLGAVSSLYAVS